MIITINGKIVKPKNEPQQKALMSPWFKKCLLVIGGLFFLFFASASFLKDDEGSIMALLIFLLFGLIIFGMVVLISAIVTAIKKFLKFKMVIYY
ncbi:MAG: hypothetical protein Q8P53_03960 [Candidatus Shapirobacteria bacterium]|nr:hypothetical protein [Candidatus Shapirobacteria bacterium]